MECIDYESFKTELLERLEKFPSGEAEIIKVKKNNGVCYDGIRFKYPETALSPLIPAEQLYGIYKNGNADLDSCALEAYMKKETAGFMKETAQFSRQIPEWDAVKGDVRPVLLSAEANREQADALASMPFLDLTIVYAIRKRTDGRHVTVKITRAMLDGYGITVAQLHEQAMENLREDGYGFFGLTETGVEKRTAADRTERDCGETPRMYVLTNRSSLYGAAGILNRELVREFAGKQDFFILPSSIHEVIFVCAFSKDNKSQFDRMVREVNQTEVMEEDRLSDHCYFYDAGTGEIRTHA